MPRLPGRHSDGRSHKKQTPEVILTTGQKVETPALPNIGRDWHPMTKTWWADGVTGLWASPMASELAKADVNALHRVAVLVDDYWRAETPRDRAVLSGEIRLAAALFGLDPTSRRRLGWHIHVEPERATTVQRFIEEGRRARYDSRDFLRDVS